MRDLVASAMRDGCFGLSTGPGVPARACTPTPRSWWSSPGSRGRPGASTRATSAGRATRSSRAVAEALEIGSGPAPAVQISHHKAAFRPYWGRIRQATRLSEWAQARGQDATFDVYPYTAGSAPLTQIIPDWAHEGGLQALLARLRAPASRARLPQEIAEQGREWDQTLVGWMPAGPGRTTRARHRRHRRPPGDRSRRRRSSRSSRSRARGPSWSTSS